MEQETATLAGKVERVFFARPDGQWMAGILVDDEGNEARFQARCSAERGDRLELVGRWEIDPKWGRQFVGESGIVKMDESPDALIHLLASDCRFRGLGIARARKVVEAALALSDDGDMASSLVQHPQEIAARAKVPVEIVENARDVWCSKRSYFDSLALLCEQGWSNAQAQAVIDKFGENAPTMIRRDPYMVIGAIPRFGFRTVDAVAKQMGVSVDDPARLAAGLTYCLDRMSNDGNTWTTREGLLAEAMQELRPDTLQGEGRTLEALEKLIATGWIAVEHSPQGTELVADANLAAIELEVFETLVKGLTDTAGPEEHFYQCSLTLDGPRATAVLATLNEGQLEAAKGFSTHRYSLISGGAGVGKTYLMNAICEIAEENSLKVELCAPTGKAARKLSHATGRDSKTIHRLLEPGFDEETGQFTFARGPKYPIEAGLVVVDEASMVDVRLAHKLLRALAPDTRLLLVGDHHQIPSVGPGAILRDVLAGHASYPGAVHVLREVVRQAGELARNTSAILNGIVVNTTSPAWAIQKATKGNDEGTAAIVATMVEALVTGAEPLEPFGRALDFAWDVQVLAPTKKGDLGTWELNRHLQKLRQRLLGHQVPPEVNNGERAKPLVGDRVIWTKNDYTLELFNGTQAIVTDLRKGGVMDLFIEDGREVTIPASKRNLIELAYAITIHKAQGSEWPAVLLVCSSAHWYQRDRNLLYTGASRAAESLTIIGDMAGIRGYAQQQRSAGRQTFGAFFVHGWRPTFHVEQRTGTQGVVDEEAEDTRG
jgi:exodeoxyribonuclease V alpha subunit